MARGDRRHVVTVQNPGAPVADGDGGFTETWTDGTPAQWHVSITPATQADLERLAAGTVISTASHVVRGDFHPEVTTLTRLVFGAQVFAITGTVNVDLRSIDLLCGVVEVVR